MNDCKGCRYENSTDIEVHLEFCSMNDSVDIFRYMW